MHQKRFPFDFSAAIDCVTKSQYLLDSISSTCTFRFSSVILSCFSFLYLSKKKIHNFRSPETQTKSKSGKIQMKTNRGLFQKLSGFETGHPAAAGPLPAFDFSVSDEQDAAFLVSVMDCSDCDSSGLDSPNSSWSIDCLKECLRRKNRPSKRGKSRAS